MIEIIKNILPEDINKQIVLYLVNSDRWRIAKDVSNDYKLLEDLLNSSGGDYGNSLQTFDEFNQKFIDTPLNIYAEVIYSLVKSRSSFNCLKAKRFYWNYYNTAATPEIHKDREENNYISFVYNLNTNDGGTEINNKFYPSVSGEAIVFKSNIPHRGVAPKSFKSRFNLNCIVELKINV